jgi:hypothetical protein
MKNMKTSPLFAGLACLALGFSMQAQKQLVKLWQTEADLKVPESVLFNKEEQTLYFSNIEGDYKEKDHKGSVGKLSPDGKNKTIDWVTGLNAPKGLGIYNGILYAADVDEVAEIDMKAGKIVKNIPIKDAAFLNDISIDAKGNVYVSDTKTGIVHRIMGDQVETYLDKQIGVNGLLCVNEDLYFLANGALWKADKEKHLTKMAEGMDNSTDGLEQTKNGDFVVSSWSGLVYYVTADGKVTQLLDTREQKLNTADIGFDAEKNIVYVPTFFGNSITAYELK